VSRKFLACLITQKWGFRDNVPERSIASYEKLRRDYHVAYFDGVGWRGVFTFDLNGNTVELVAKDPE